MGTKRIFLLVFAATLFGLISPIIADAQNYPDRLIKIVVPYPPGGPADVSARLVVAPLSSKLGQIVVIENQSGAGGRTGAKAVTLASPDGYTLQLGGTKRIFLLVFAATLFGLISPIIADAQTYPDRLIKIGVPYPPGGPADVSARLVVAPLSSKLGQIVVIENQSGGGGRRGAQAVTLASPDGYTLQLGGTKRIFLLVFAATLFGLISPIIADAQNYPDRLI